MAQYQTADQTHKSGHSTAELKDMATDQFSKVADRVEQATQSVTEHAHDASDRVQAMAGQVKTAVDKSVKEQPMMTLAMAGVVGFVLGALWKS
jgi:ElaB/YqjD/DUF883 family membrane-anchored ribosome-binding protein